MSTEPVLPRANAAIDLILAQTPPIDVLLLQELTSVSHPVSPSANSSAARHSTQVAVFRDRLTPKYTLHLNDDWAATIPYFPAIFTRNRFFAPSPPLSVSHVLYPGSRMQRGYVLVDGVVPNAGRVAFLTSHMESESPNKEERRAQLNEIAAIMRGYAARGATAIFGGDSNLREAEILGSVVAKKPADERAQRMREAGGSPLSDDKRKLSDAYVQAFPGGDDYTHRFTWDMRKNDNLKPEGGWGEHPPQSRFDRIFLIGPADRYPACTTWQLLGKERLPPIEPGVKNVFPSDHWAVCADISIPVLSGDKGGEGTVAVDTVVHHKRGGGVQISDSRNDGLDDAADDDDDDDDGFCAKPSKKYKKKSSKLEADREATKKRRKLE
jgi:hypothetical protein